MVERDTDKGWTTTHYILNREASPRLFMYKCVKKLADILLSLIGLIVCAPILIIAVILIKLETKGPFIYIQQRVGKNGRLFEIYKLRTMCMNAEKDGMQWAQKDDPRVTRLGRYLRKTRIDELPQLINVLRGEMSIVGPRPERLHFTEEFCREIPRFYERLAVLPGITGWSQVNGGYELTPGQKLEKDLYYIENRSISLDFLIILKTIRIVFTFEGAR